MRTGTRRVSLAAAARHAGPPRNSWRAPDLDANDMTLRRLRDRHRRPVHPHSGSLQGHRRSGHNGLTFAKGSWYVGARADSLIIQGAWRTPWGVCDDNPVPLTAGMCVLARATLACALAQPSLTLVHPTSRLACVLRRACGRPSHPLARGPGHCARDRALQRASAQKPGRLGRHRHACRRGLQGAPTACPPRPIAPRRAPTDCLPPTVGLCP